MIARLIEVRPIAPQVSHFLFEVPEVESFPFKTGQFVSMSREINGKKITRAYSTAGRPDGNRFELCLNLVENGHFSPFLFGMKVGDMVDFKGPVGQFVWREERRDSVMVATGTGIAPFRGMLHERVRQDPDHQYTLIFGVRYDHSLLYRDEFEALDREFPNFSFQPTVTRPEAGWDGRVGRVQPLVEAAVGDRTDIDVYICGLKEMVDSVRELLKAKGFDKKHIIFEKYD